nr:hypothetical protein [Tanacetum cinerariifolium]
MIVEQPIGEDAAEVHDEGVPTAGVAAEDLCCCEEGHDVMRLQALVDKKKVIITKATIRDALHLDDAEGIECLPNEKIFAELARMGYEKPSTKLTFYKAFFSSQWKFLIYTILQCMSAKQTSWNEFSSSMASTVICLSIGKGFSGVETPLFKGMIVEQQVNGGKGCSGVETSLFEGMIVAQQVGEGVAEVNVKDVYTADVAAEGAASVADDKVPAADKIAQALEIKKLKQRVKKLERRNKLKASKLRSLKKVGTSQKVKTFDDTVMDDVSKQGRIIADMDADKDVTLKDVAAVAKDVQDAEIKESLDVQGRKAESQAQIYQIDLEHADKRVRSKAKKNIDRDEVIDHVQRKEKKDNTVKRYQALKRKPQTEAQARKNMMIYLRNTKEQMEEEDNRALKRLSETQEEKATKKQKLDEEVAELKRHLQIVPSDKDDVYTEATSLAHDLVSREKISTFKVHSESTDQHVVPLSPSKTPGTDLNPVGESPDSDSNMGIWIDDFIAIDDQWDDLDPGALTNDPPLKLEFLSSRGKEIEIEGKRIDAIDQDEDIILVNVQDDAEMFDVDDLGGKEGKGIMVEEPTKPKKKDQIRLDEEAALRLQAKFDMEERLARERAQKEQEANIALIKKELVLKILKKFDKAFKRVNKFKDFRTELVQGKEKREKEELIQESTKKQKVEDNKETAESKQLMEIILDKEEVAIDAIPLAVKSLRIVDWKIYTEGKKAIIK